MLIKLWDDPEIGGRLFNQAAHLQVEGILGKERSDLFMGEYLWSVMHKLSACRYHLERYIDIEKHERAAWRKRFKKEPNTGAEAFSLIFEFEAFMYQVKSSLDMLAKLLDAVGLKNAVSTYTYGSKGKDIITGLNANIDRLNKLISSGGAGPGTDRLIGKLQQLIRLVERARDSWLTEAVDIRDALSHRRGAREFFFKPAYHPNGFVEAIPPQYKGRNIVELMAGVMRTLVEFHQDFMAHALALEGNHLQLVELTPDQQPSDLPELHRRFIKWGWRIDGKEELVGGFIRVPGSVPPERQ